MTIDEELGMVYLPVELPTGDYYGGNRPGNGLFGESVVALDLKTGVRKWHYQLVHHGIWDMDIPCAPILADITVDGKKIKALAQITKQGWVYVFDRTNGQPVWPIEERPVEKGDVPGEWYAPTQPFVTKPPAFDRQGVSPDDVIAHAGAARGRAEADIALQDRTDLHTAGRQQGRGTVGTLVMPSATNWPGSSLDQRRTFCISFAHPPARAVDDQRSEAIGHEFPRASAAGRGGGGGCALSVQGLPLIKPLYGRITAIDLNKGDISWQVAHGDTPDNIKNHPALKGIEIPRTGRPGRIGVLATKTLLIAGEGGFNTTPNGQRGAMLRAYDKATGQDAGAVYMPAPQTGSPMTYFYNNKQYILVAISGASYTGELVAFKLP
jgi:quinoprotein glucose dehydrogenase